MSDNLFTDDDVTAAREALVKRWCEPSNDIDGIVRHVLEAVAPSIAARERRRVLDLILRGEPEGPAAIHFCYFCDDLWESEPTCEHYQRLRDRADQIEGKT